MCADASARPSGVTSPVSSCIRSPRPSTNLARQSAIRSRTSALSGAIIRITASSAVTVLPEPVGAPTRTLTSVCITVWKICVCTGLKWENRKRRSKEGSPSADLGRGRSGSSSVCVGRTEGSASPDRGSGTTRLEEWSGEGELLDLVGLPPGERPELFVVDVLRVRVLHPDPPALGAAMHPLTPLEGGSQPKSHPQHCTSDGLRRHFDRERGERGRLRAQCGRLPLIGDELPQLAHAHLPQRLDACG
eukprot:scaffold11940_cov106-Isochrysis_galbana.AAC.8